MEPKCALIMGTADALISIFGFFFGILPYLVIERDLAALPYMTRDYLKMKKEERRIAKTTGGKAFLTFYIYMTQICNICWNPVLVHLSKRGIFTAYWVLNQEGEVVHLARTSKVNGLMTDRPALIKPYLQKNRQK